MAVQTAGAAALEPRWMEDWLALYISRWNAQDVEAIVSMYTADADYHDPSNPGWIHGHDGIRTFLGAVFRAFPDLSFEPVGPPLIAANQPRAAGPYRMTGTMSGFWDAQNLAPTGARVDVAGVSVWDFRGELACRYETFFDALDMTRQLGILPPQGGSLDRLMTRGQHLQAWLQRRRRRTGR